MSLVRKWQDEGSRPIRLGPGRSVVDLERWLRSEPDPPQSEYLRVARLLQGSEYAEPDPGAPPLHLLATWQTATGWTP